MTKTFVINDEDLRHCQSSKLRTAQFSSKMNAPIEKPPLEFASNGFLVEGIHDCTWTDLQNLAFTNGHRRKLGNRLLSFFQWLNQIRGFSRIYIGGGFVSDRSRPTDIDVILETKDPFGPQAFAAIEPLFVTGLDNIRSQYLVHVHFWMESAPQSIVDYRAFFQYVRPQRRRRSLFSGRGIVRLALSSCGLDEEAPGSGESHDDRGLSSFHGNIQDPLPDRGVISTQAGAFSRGKPQFPTAKALSLLLALITALGALPGLKADDDNLSDSNLVENRLSDAQSYPKFAIPTDSSDSGLPQARYTSKTGSFLVTINDVDVPVVYSLPMEGTRLAPTASNLVFYGPYPGEKTQLKSNLVPDIVTKLGCSVFSFQFEGLGQAVSSKPYYSESLWFEAALKARDQIIQENQLEARKLILFGYSGGGGMVMNFAGYDPDDVEAVAAQAPNVVPPLPRGNRVKWLMVVNRGDNNRSVMKPFYAKLRADGSQVLYCETTPDRDRGHYHSPSKQTYDLIYDFIAGVLDQRKLDDDGTTDVARIWPYAAPDSPLQRYAIVKTVHLQPEDLGSGKFDLLPSLPFTIGWSRVCPPEQNIVPNGTRAKLILNFPAREIPAGIVLYYDNPSLADVPREIEDINSLAEHGYLVVSSMTAGPDEFVQAATLWINGQPKLQGLHIHLVGNGQLGAQFISKIAERRDISFKSLSLLDFDGSSYDSGCMDSLTFAAKECGMYGFYDYLTSDEPAKLNTWATDLVDQGAEARGCFNLRCDPEKPPAQPDPKRHMNAEIQSLSMVEALMAKADLP